MDDFVLYAVATGLHKLCFPVDFVQYNIITSLLAYSVTWAYNSILRVIIQQKNIHACITNVLLQWAVLEVNLNLP